MVQIKTFAELTTPDERTLRFTPLGFSTGGTLKPEDAAEFQQEVIAHCDLSPEVAEGTRNSFERLQTLHSYGILFYEAFSIADDLAWLVMEQAFRERFVAYFNCAIPFVDSKSGSEDSITAQDFDEVYKAVTRGGSHGAAKWKLKVRSTGDQMVFKGSFTHLLKWARQEGLLYGQRNKGQEDVYRQIRNRVAHPTYHLGTPVDSAHTIHDLAEIINRLWGQATPGGRLYPAPLEQEVIVVGWGNDESHTMTQLRAEQLAWFNEPGDWTCVVIRGVREQDEFWDFDAQFERTTFPSELLWGPGSRDEARAWLESENPTAGTVQYLDRLFAIRIHDGRVSLARRPEVALAVPPDRRDGRWLVIRADYPNDAFAHARHIKDGVKCGNSKTHVRKFQPGVIATSPPIPSCAVEEMIDGGWEYMVDQLGKRFKITEPAELIEVRVPPRWGVAPDVEAD